MQREEIAAVGDFRIIYTGLRLDQADLDVFQQVLHQARSTPLGHVVRFNRRDMLKHLGRAQGKSDRDWLLKSLSRLAACEIEISNGRLAFSGSLIQNQARDEEAGMHYIILDPKLATIYDQGWSPMPWEKRKALGRKQLAKWYQAFIAGQRNPLTFHIVELERLSCSNYSRQRRFRDELEQAAADVRSVGEDTVLLWDLKRKTVTITKTRWRNATAIPLQGDSGGD